MARPWTLGVEIGGTKLQVALATLDGHLVQNRRSVVVPRAGAVGILHQIEKDVADILDSQTLRRDEIEGIGIGFGGPVDSDGGFVICSHQIAGWDQFPLADWVRRTLEIDRVRIENDADTAALGEAVAGAGIGYSPLLYLTIGSGIGGGLILDQSIYRGSGRGAVEIGHLLINDPECIQNSESSPGVVTLESVASGWGIARRSRLKLSELLDSNHLHKAPVLSHRFANRVEDLRTEDVAKAASEGDALAIRMIDTATTAVAEALGHAISLLAPERVILGGGVSMIGPALWIEPIRRKTRGRVFPQFRELYEIVTASLGEEVVLRGAFALITD